MEGARGEGDVKGDSPRPCLQLEVVLMNVIEAFEGEIDPTEDIHGLLSRTRCVSVAPLDVTVHLPRLQPNARIHIKDGQIV